MKRKVTEEKTRNFHLCLISEGGASVTSGPGARQQASTGSEISNKLISAKRIVGRVERVPVLKRSPVKGHGNPCAPVQSVYLEFCLTKLLRPTFLLLPPFKVVSKELPRGGLAIKLAAERKRLTSITALAGNWRKNFSIPRTPGNDVTADRPRTPPC